MQASTAILWVLVLAAVLLPAQAACGGPDGVAAAEGLRTVRYDSPVVEAAPDGRSVRTYVGRGEHGEPRVHQIVVIPAGWTFEDESSLIRVRGTCVHDATGFEVDLVTQVDEEHFCRTHVAAAVVAEGVHDGVPYCILELENAREWTIQQRILANNGMDTVEDVESSAGATLPPEGSTTVHYSFQIPHVTGWLAAADVATPEQRALMEDLVLRGLRVSFQNPYAERGQPAGPPPDRD